PTPLIDSRRRRNFLSANSVMSRIGAGPEMAMPRMGMASGSIFWMIGGSASFGRSRRMVLTLSRTSCAATSMSFSRTKETMTCEVPSDEIDCSSSTPLMVLTASSILSLMSVSISSGAAPTRRVVMVIVGMSTFGKRSTPSCWYANQPTTTRERMRTVAKTGRLTQSSASLCIGLHLHSGKQPRPQLPVLIRELRLHRERPRGRIDHAAHNRHPSGEDEAGIRIDARLHFLSAMHLGEVLLGDAEAQLERRRLHDHERDGVVAEALADVGPLLGHDAVDRRAEHRVAHLLAVHVRLRHSRG